MGWGKKWPEKSYTVSRKENFPDETEGKIDNPKDDEEPIPEETTFTCLCNVDLLMNAFYIQTDNPLSTIVILEEYEYLRQKLESSTRTIIVEGQPGTGS